MAAYRTPDVCIDETSLFPPSVAEVETAIPTFIGYSVREVDEAGRSLANQPTKIFSSAEDEQYFGGPATAAISVALTRDGAGVRADVTPLALTYLLHHAVKLFFDKGGSQCCFAAARGFTGVALATQLPRRVCTLGHGLRVKVGARWHLVMP